MKRHRVSRSGLPLNASPETHEKVLKWFASWPRGAVLDCPAGAGALSHELQQMGFEVVAADLGRSSVSSSRVRLDLNRPLPFSDEAFDYVACVEGIEHLERPVDALREMRRVMRRSGRLVLTTPNVLHLGSRARMLLTGFWKSAPRPFNPDCPPTGLEHIMLLSYPMLMYFLARAGFEVEQFTVNRVVRGSLPWTWLALPAAVATWIALRRTPDRAMARVLLSPRLLFGHALLLACRAR